MNKRYLTNLIRAELKEKMVFLGGPRQVGKATLGLSLWEPPLKSNPAYSNWDIADDAKKIRINQLLPHAKLLIFGEIHKFARWKNFIKGIYDANYPDRNCLVTDSMRLDLPSLGNVKYSPPTSPATVQTTFLSHLA